MIGKDPDQDPMRMGSSREIYRDKDRRRRETGSETDQINQFYNLLILTDQESKDIIHPRRESTDQSEENAFEKMMKTGIQAKKEEAKKPSKGQNSGAKKMSKGFRSQKAAKSKKSK